MNTDLMKDGIAYFIFLVGLFLFHYKSNIFIYGI